GQVQTNFLYQGVRLQVAAEMGLNDAGEMVFAGTTTGSNALPILVSEGRVANLNGLMPSNSPFATLLAATAINNSGDIAGYGLTIGGRMHGFLMRRLWVVGQPIAPPLRVVNPA